MNPLSYIQAAATYAELDASSFGQSTSIGLITNFTDNVLQKILIGLCIQNDIYPTLHAQAYKQYHFDFANKQSALYKTKTDITYIIFDSNPYIESEFTNTTSHVQHALAGIRTLATQTGGHVVIATMPEPSQSVYGNLRAEDPAFEHVLLFNKGIADIAHECSNVTLFSIDRLFQLHGDSKVRDLRALYAFDIPYSNDFSLVLCRELTSYLFALRGKTKKCIVVDLDNTLWGGIVGEVGAHGIKLGPGYPGLAFQNFQRVLRAFNKRGIILAIASKNNENDVNEVFETNTHMVLSKKDFASMQVHWKPKSESIKAIAHELNIGIDSIVFVDDDPANREEVRTALPQVLVVDLPQEPEEYIRTLLSLSCFNQLKLTEEDKQKNAQYAEERERKALEETIDPTEYLAKLGIVVQVTKNNHAQIPRLAQLSQKTNQFNLTTHRYSEHDIETMIIGGALVYAADVRDTFGHYGIVALAICKPLNNKTIAIDTFLMSCRAMGRGVEYGFMDTLFESFKALGYDTVTGSFVATAKNEPAKSILPDLSFGLVDSQEGAVNYTLDLNTYTTHKPSKVIDVLPHITITNT